jgi:hypothetical protein
MGRVRSFGQQAATYRTPPQLDEPTNHLDLPGIEWLRRALAGMHLGKLRGQPRPPAAGAPLSATIWLDRGITRILNEASRRSRPGVTRSWSMKKASITSSAARSRSRRIGCATGSPLASRATADDWPSCTRSVTGSAPVAISRNALSHLLRRTEAVDKPRAGHERGAVRPLLSEWVGPATAILTMACFGLAGLGLVWACLIRIAPDRGSTNR